MLFQHGFYLQQIMLERQKNRDDVIYSPDKNKSIEIIQGVGTNQLILNFHKFITVGGSNVAVGDFDSNQISTKWDGNNHLIVLNPLNIKLRSKETIIKFFSEEVSVSYE